MIRIEEDVTGVCVGNIGASSSGFYGWHGWAIGIQYDDVKLWSAIGKRCHLSVSVFGQEERSQLTGELYLCLNEPLEQ